MVETGKQDVRGTELRMATYQLLDHTADFGVVVYGANAEQLFANAGQALFENLCGCAGMPDQWRDLEIAGADWADLMFNWLRALLALWTDDGLAGLTIRVGRLSENSISARIGCVVYKPEIHALRNEIKAVTYHQLAVDPCEDGWTATVIFDI